VNERRARALAVELKEWPVVGARKAGKELTRALDDLDRYRDRCHDEARVRVTEIAAKLTAERRRREQAERARVAAEMSRNIAEYQRDEALARLNTYE
jgi:hypothetical protein